MGRPAGSNPVMVCQRVPRRHSAVPSDQIALINLESVSKAGRRSLFLVVASAVVIAAIVWWIAAGTSGGDGP